MGIKAAGAYLRACRECLGRSRAWVVQNIDADERQLARIEAGETDTRGTLLFKLAEIIGADLKQLQKCLREDDESFDKHAPHIEAVPQETLYDKAPDAFYYHSGVFEPATVDWPELDIAEDANADDERHARRDRLAAAGFKPFPLMSFGEERTGFTGSVLIVHERAKPRVLVTNNPVDYYVAQLWEDNYWEFFVAGIGDLLDLLERLTPLTERHRRLVQSAEQVRRTYNP